MILLGLFVVIGSALAIWGFVVSEKINNDNTKRNLAIPFFGAAWCAMVAASIAGVAFLLIIEMIIMEGAGRPAYDYGCFFYIGLACFFIYSFVGILLSWRAFKKGK